MAAGSGILVHIRLIPKMKYRNAIFLEDRHCSKLILEIRIAEELVRVMSPRSGPEQGAYYLVL